MATYDPFAAANKKKVRRGPDGFPVMEVDAEKRPPVGQYGVQATPFPIAGQRPVGPMTAGLPPPIAAKPLPPNAGYTDETKFVVDRPAASPMADDLANRPSAPVAAAPTAAPGTPTAATPIQPMAADAPPPLPFNDRKARQRAQADYARALHTDSQGLTPFEREQRIAGIRGAEDVRDAYSRANAPLQKVQSPGEIADRHSELARQLVGYKRTKVEEMDKAIQAAMNEPLSEDKQRKIDVLVAQRANAADDLQKTLSDPYWQQTSPEKAGQIQAGQTRLRERQMADRASGAADVAAYRGREQYGRNMADEVRQAEFARQRAAVGAETAGYGAQAAASNAIQQSGGLTPEQQVAQMEATLRKRELEQAINGDQGGATPYNANRAAEKRASAYGIVGIDTPEQRSAFIDRARSDLAALKDRTGGLTQDFDTTDIIRGFEEQTMPLVEQMAALDPATAAGMARELLAAIPADPHGSVTNQIGAGIASTMTGLPTSAFSGSQQTAVAGLSNLRRRLAAIARPQLRQ